MSSWAYVALGYALTAVVLLVAGWRSERRIAALRRRLQERAGGPR